MHPLERAITAEGLTSAQFAELIGVSKQTVCAWVNGKGRPKPHYYPRMAEVLKMTGLEVTELICPSDKPVMAGKG
jgi:transcriptional regulator with XRE-family HTH domain